MPTYRVTDPETGKTLKITGDSPPTEQELQQIFGGTTEFRMDQPQGGIPLGFVPPRTAAENIGRGVGLTARNILEIPANIADFGAQALNVIPAAISKGDQLLGGKGTDVRLPTDNTQVAGELLTQAGLPVAETPLERVGSDIQKAVATTAIPIKGGAAMQSSASPVTRGVGTVLESNPAIQGASAVTSAGAGGVTREVGGTPGQQIGASLAGAFAPAALVTGAQGLARTALRGGEGGRQVLQENIDTFARAGTTPSLGQGTQGRIAQATESFLTKTPGGAGRMSAAAQGQADDVATRIERVADDLAPKATAERAGRAIREGVEGFVDDFKGTAGRLYDDVDQHVNTSGPVRLEKTSQFLQGKTAPIEGAEETSQLLSSKFLDDISEALGTDLQAAAQQGIDGLPYSAIKALRSRVGEKRSSLSLIDDATKGDLKRLYGALSDDLASFAATQGDDAVRATRRADAFYKAGRERIDELEKVVNKNGGPEKVFNAAVSGTKEGATTLRTVMKSLKPEQKRMLSAAVVRRMGKATPGQQDASAEAFSINTFLTNWAKLSPEARGTLFGTYGQKFQKDMDAIASFASNIRSGSDVFRNPSGTGQAITQNAAAIGTLGSAALGQFELAAVLGGTTVGSNWMARLMTNPRFVNWLAVQTKVPPGAYTAQVSALGRLAAQDRDIALAYGLLQEQQDNTAQQEDGRQQ